MTFMPLLSCVPDHFTVLWPLLAFKHFKHHLHLGAVISWLPTHQNKAFVINANNLNRHHQHDAQFAKSELRC